MISMSLTEMANFSSQYINKAKLDDIAIVHGDMCFSNILFDSRIQAVKLIDPRGLSANGNVTIWGDKRYDLAKFYHSALGLYDLIIANRFKIDVANDIYNIEFSSGINQLDLSNVIKKSIFEKSKYEESEIIAINVQLFLSMLPLHYDRPDRQQAMIANALRLTSKLVKLETLNKCL
ncbi:hypothetical protein [Paraglaciecola sp.]|uniref:hypothetical protein n=1 Tax=Paraglaciecola sp. TaxID=1920173 RepID=UPI003265A48B